MYKIIQHTILGNTDISILLDKGNNEFLSFPAEKQNPNFETFKTQVLAGAELLDADGNVMTDASAYIASLP